MASVPLCNDSSVLPGLCYTVSSSEPPPLLSTQGNTCTSRLPNSKDSKYEYALLVSDWTRTRSARTKIVRIINWEKYFVKIHGAVLREMQKVRRFYVPLCDNQLEFTKYHSGD